MLGVAAALLFTAALAVAFVHLAHITGLSSEEVTLLRSGTGADLIGLIAVLPLTTLLAPQLAMRLLADRLSADEHAH